MREDRRFLRVGLLVAMLFVAGFGTQASAATRTWSSTAATNNWGTASNWDENAVPGSGDDVVFNTNASVTLSGATTINSLTVGSSAAVTITSDYQILTADLSVEGQLSLAYATNNGSPTYLLNVTDEVELEGNGTIDGAVSSYRLPVYINIGTSNSGTIEMDTVATNYIGSGIYTNIARKSVLHSSVRFEGDINLPNGLALGIWNLYLGIDAEVFTPNMNTGNASAGYKCIQVDGDNSIAAGTVRKQYSAVDDEFTFNVAPGTDKVCPITIKIISPTTSTSFTSAVPWPYISVRVVMNQGQNKGHPENQQSNKVWMHWPVKGYGIVSPVYLAGQMVFENNYRSGSSGDNLYSARYTPNYEDGVTATSGWDLTGTGQNTSTNSINTIPFNGFPGFGDFSVGTGDPFGGDPVPVELSSFSARYVDNTVRLNWNTATELNNYGFAIERSEDSENWEEVGFVPGYGTSSSPKSYTHTDKLTDDATHAPQLAYRLRQIDRDGTTDYSNIVFVKTGELPSGVELYAAYPNPFNPATTISFTVKESANVNLKVYNTFGQEVATLLSNSAMDAGLHTVSFNGEQLPSGVYMAVLETNGDLQQQKLVLNK